MRNWAAIPHNPARFERFIPIQSRRAYSHSEKLRLAKRRAQSEVFQGG